MSSSSASAAFNLVGKTAFITGAAQGIGLGIAQRFAAAGANVAMLDLPPPPGTTSAKLAESSSAATTTADSDQSAQQHANPNPNPNPNPTRKETAAAGTGRLDDSALEKAAADVRLFCDQWHYQKQQQQQQQQQQYREQLQIPSSYSDAAAEEQQCYSTNLLRPRIATFTGDVSDRESLAAAFEEAVDYFGGTIDIVVANAATTVPTGEVAEWGNDAEAWAGVSKTFGVTQQGALNTCALAARHMRERARISNQAASEKEERTGAAAVNTSASSHMQKTQAYQPNSSSATSSCTGKILIISSIMGEFYSSGRMAYTMGKAALNHMGPNLAREMAPDRVNVNVILPGYIDTPGERKIASEKEVQAAADSIPWKRLGTPEDVGNTAVFLCSPAADYITGASIRVDGGYMTGLSLRCMFDWEDEHAIS